MRGLTRRWLLHQPNGNAPSGPTPLVQRLMAARGLTDPEAIRHFCEPKLTDLHDPSLMAGVDVAANCLAEAIRAGKRIVIYGDYDVDGITATAILYHVIRTIQPDADVRSYVPHRMEEGYGLNVEAMRQIAADGADLVISVDCGITAVEPATVARDLGLELIITDHHTLPPDHGDLPPAVALVHPGLPGENGESYPFADLCGAGVAFKLAWRLATVWCGSERVSNALQTTLLHMLPLAALGTIADVVPLVGENRIIASFGLRTIKQTPIAGLRALIESSDLMEDSIDSQKVGFILGPKLNACGRMGHAAEAVHMLTNASEAEAMEIATRLAKLNRERQKTERDIVDLACSLAEDSGMANDDHRVIVLAHESWHPGVVGIACSRLAERFGRPVILMQKQGDECRGSARSIDGYSIHDGLSHCADLLTTFGGHMMAAGLRLPVANLDAFTTKLREHANARIEVDQLVPSIRIDCDARLEELDADAVKQIGMMSPFGRGNRRPTIRIMGATLEEAPRQIGGQGRHLSVRLRQDVDGRRKVMRGVWWKAGGLANTIAPGMSLDVAIEPKFNTWRGRTTVEAELFDVRVAEGQQQSRILNEPRP